LTIENFIKERNRIALAFLQLKKEKNFSRIPADKRIDLINEVWSVGENLASWAMAETDETDPRKIAEKLGVVIFGADRGNLKKSEYRKKEKEIVIFRDALERLTSEIVVPELSEKILRFLVSYELFHHLENTKTGFIYKRFKFPLRFGFNFYLKSLSEVAALAFTQKLISLELSPQVFDYLVYILFNSDFKA